MRTSADIEDLKSQIRGDVVLPGAACYDTLRAVWNAMIDRHPDVIVQCRGTADVMAAVKFARAHGLNICVRGGGHNIAGTGVCDGGLMLDLSTMRAVQVDPVRRLARVEGGATVGDLDHETQAFGLATPGGVVSTTGVGGLTLGGGFGWLARLYGLAADNLVSVDLVTTEGDLLTASEQENADLFWALRGGGGNFGIVTSFLFRLHRLGPEVLFGPTVHPLEDAADVLKHYRDFAAGAPRECCVWADLMTAPPLPFLDQCHHGTKVLTLMQFYAGDPAEGESVLAPLRGFGEPIGDAVGRTVYTEAQSRLDPVYERGARNYWRAYNFADLVDPVPEIVTQCAADMPTAQSDILICQLGGAISDVAPEASAYPHRHVTYSITPGARWLDPAMDGECLAWIRSAFEPLVEHAQHGAYVNFIAEAAGRERDAYGANYERLAALKARYDPENLLRSNQNVLPARDRKAAAGVP